MFILVESKFHPQYEYVIVVINDDEKQINSVSKDATKKQESGGRGLNTL
jgi:hypothetical protein